MCLGIPGRITEMADDAYRRYRENYNEQRAWHLEERGV